MIGSLAFLALPRIDEACPVLTEVRLPQVLPRGNAEITIPAFGPHVPWNQLILSWSVKTPATTWLKVYARVHQGEHLTRWYTLGFWSQDETVLPRESIKDQADEDGKVDTDTLLLNKPGGQVEIKLGSNHLQDVKLLTACFANTASELPAVPENAAAWGKVIDVPERAQGNYPGGSVLCSPTSVSMLLWHWSQVLNQPSLDHDVPLVAKRVFDRNWPGTGNWPFNTAFAGSLPGVRAYVTRLGGIGDLETFIAAGIPVATSVSYDLLKGKPVRGSNDGHLVVLVGFAPNGDPIFNDPGHKVQERRSYPRADFEKAWGSSLRTVYLIYPEGAKVPVPQGGRWLPKE